MKITRRSFLKTLVIIISIIIGRIMILKLFRNDNKIKLALNQNLNNFSTTIIHSLADSDNGKSFIIPNFPVNCIINAIRIRSNYIADNNRIWTVFVDHTNGIIPTDTLIPYRGAWNGPVIGRYVFIDNEIVFIISDDGSNLIVKRGVKGTAPSFHDNNSPIRIINKGLRLILFKNINKKLFERLKIFNNLMTWQGTTNSAIINDDKFIRFSAPIENIEQYDFLYLNDRLNPEIASVEYINNAVYNDFSDNMIFVTEPLALHGTGIDVQKLIIFDELISYKGENNLYGILYVDGNIEKNKYINGVIVDLELSII